MTDEARGFANGELMEKILALLPPKSEIHFITPYNVDIQTTYRINDHVIDVGFSLSLDLYRAGLLKELIHRSAQQAMGLYISSLFSTQSTSQGKLVPVSVTNSDQTLTRPHLQLPHDYKSVSPSP